MPGVLGSLLSCIVVSFASKEIYGDGINNIFPEWDGVTYTGKEQASFKFYLIINKFCELLAAGIAESAQEAFPILSLSSNSGGYGSLGFQYYLA